MPIGERGDVTAFQKAYIEAGGGDALGCAFNAVHDWGPGQIQDLAGGSGRKSALMALPGQPVRVLTGEAWSDYEALGATQRGGSGEVAGYPGSNAVDVAGGSMVPLQGGRAGTGPLLRAPGAERYIWVSGLFWKAYQRCGGPTGRLGFPLGAGLTYRQLVNPAVSTGELEQSGAGRVRLR